MLATESTLVKRAMNLLFLGVLVTATGIYVFRTELADTVSDSFAGNDAAIKRRWLPGTGGKLVLRPERNDEAFLQVGALRSGMPSSIGVPVSFDLINLGDANDFPNIAVVMVGADRRPIRQILFSPADYTHDNRFGHERVELLLQPRAGERSFTVRAFYGERP
jgi:hypothetical protein